MEIQPNEILNKHCPKTVCFLGSIGACAIWEDWKTEHKTSEQVFIIPVKPIEVEINKIMELREEVN